jgi:hypothetical protein
VSTTEVADAAAADHDGPTVPQRALVAGLGAVTDTAAEEIRTYLEQYGKNPDPKLIDDALREMECATRGFHSLIATGKSLEDAADDAHRRVLAEVLVDKVEDLAGNVEPHMTRYMRDPTNLLALHDAANLVRDLSALFEALFAVAHPGEPRD